MTNGNPLWTLKLESPLACKFLFFFILLARILHGMQEQCKFKKQTNINIKYTFQTLLKSIKQPVIK